LLNLSYIKSMKLITSMLKKASLALALMGLSQATFAAKTEAQAAEEAKSKHGGKVVEVKKLDNKFKVKLLQSDGRVILVTIAM